MEIGTKKGAEHKVFSARKPEAVLKYCEGFLGSIYAFFTLFISYPKILTRMQRPLNRLRRHGLNRI